MESLFELLNAFFVLAVFVFWVIGVVYLFRKAKYAGWKALVPIYNLVCYCRIANVSGWFTILCFIPVVNFFAFGYLQIRIARQFGLGNLGLFFFCFFPTTVFVTIYLGFSNKSYSQEKLEASKSQVITATIAILFAMFSAGALDLLDNSGQSTTKIEIDY